MLDPNTSLGSLPTMFLNSGMPAGDPSETYQIIKVKKQRKKERKRRRSKPQNNPPPPSPPKPKASNFEPEMMPDHHSPETMERPRLPRPDILMFDMDPQPVRDIYFKFPKEWH